MTATPAPALLRVETLGGFCLWAGNAPIDLRSRKAQALLVYLLLSGTGAETRERLCGLLWSESSEEKARASLRQLLRGLRETLVSLGFPDFRFERSQIRIRRDRLALDIQVILASLEAGSVPSALAARDEPNEALLAGFDGLDPAFDAWLAIQRRLLRQRFERLLMACLEKASSSAERIAVARTLLNIDQTNEVACRALMESFASRGENAAALKVYAALWDHLDQEYDTEPSAETQALAVRLKSGPAPAEAQPARPAAHGLPAVAAQSAVVVAPFDTSGMPGANAYLATGLRQELITRLVRFREWAVIDGRHIPQGPAAAFDGRWPRQIWIDAAIAQSPSELRISFVLREQPGGRLIWGESFRFALDEWFEIERRLLSRIATLMNLHLSTARLLDTADAPEVSLEIYDRWLRGQAIIMNWRPERNRARAIYRSILAEAPTFSPAHSSLAQLESSEHLSLPGVFRSAEREAAALDHAREAVRLDPFDSRAHLALGWASLLNRQFDKAYVAFTTALQLNENDPWTINSAALGCAYCAEVDHALAVIERSPTLGLEPTAFHAAYQGAIRFVAGDYGGAVEAYQSAGGIIADLGAWEAASLAHLGRQAEAERAMRTFVGKLRTRWVLPDAPAEEHLAAWFLHCFPMRDRAAWERLRDGVGRAGLRVPPEDRIPRHP